MRLEPGKCRDFPVARPALPIKTQVRSPQVLACPADRDGGSLVLFGEQPGMLGGDL